MGVELNDWLTFSHTIGYWQNNAYSTVQSYLTQNGMPTFGGICAVSPSGNYRLQEQHLAMRSHSGAIRAATGTSSWSAPTTPI